MSHWLEDLEPAIRHPSLAEGNVNYPLHPNHFGLTEEERRLDRINAVRLQETPEDLAWAWAFFRGWYLRQAGKMFYKRFRESPPFHYQMVQDIGRYHRNAIAAPRGFSKSTVLAVEVPLLLLLTRPYFNILLILSIDSMVVKRMRTQIMYQLENNRYIREDFGEVIPRKGQGARNVHLLQIVNGATIEARPVKGGLLGARPDLCLIDDPEIDPVMNKVSAELVENFDRLLSHIILPMLDEGGSSLYWIGTLLSKRCFLHYVLTNQNDRRFEYWNRRLLDAEDDGYGNLLWPTKFDRARLDREREELGAASYNSQRRNRPGVGENQILILDEHLSCYEVIAPDEELIRSPLASKAKIIAWSGTQESPERHELDFSTTVQKMFRVCLFDWAKCLSPTSDFCCAHVIGSMGTRPFPGTWWSLDIKLGRWPGTQWLPTLFDLACKWRCQYIGIEAVAAQSVLVDAAQAYIEKTVIDDNWVPRAVPIKYETGISKEERILKLQWRFEQFRIKYPKHRRKEFGYHHLWDQTEAFTGQPGATAHDDAIDTVAMAQYLLRGRRGSQTDDESPLNRYNIYECLDRGEMLPGGIPPGLGVELSKVPPEVLAKAFDRRQRQMEEAKASGRRGPWIGS